MTLRIFTHFECVLTLNEFLMKYFISFDFSSPFSIKSVATKGKMQQKCQGICKYFNASYSSGCVTFFLARGKGSKSGLEKFEAGSGVDVLK